MNNVTVIKRFVFRFRVVGLGFFLICMFSGCSAITQVRNRNLYDVIGVWLLFMSGPLFVFGLPEMLRDCFFSALIMAGFVGMILIFAHPLRPSTATVWVTLLGCFLWYLPSFIVVLIALST